MWRYIKDGDVCGVGGAKQSVSVGVCDVDLCSVCVAILNAVMYLV